MLQSGNLGLKMRVSRAATLIRLKFHTARISTINIADVKLLLFLHFVFTEI